MAKALDKDPSTINRNINRKPTQKTLHDTIVKNLQRAGTSIRKVYKKNNEQFGATRTISAVITPDGKQKDATGQTCDFVEVPDWNAIDKAINRTLIMVGHLKQKNDNGKNNIAVAEITIKIEGVNGDKIHASPTQSVASFQR